MKKRNIGGGGKQEEEKNTSAKYIYIEIPKVFYLLLYGKNSFKPLYDGKAGRGIENVLFPASFVTFSCCVCLSASVNDFHFHFFFP